MKDDYIKRQDILDAIWKVDPENDGSDGCTIVYKNSVLTSADVESIIDRIQAADVREVVHGKWEYDEYGCYCSVCHEYALEDEYGPHNTSYCPECGAQMNRSEDDG